MTIQHNRNNRAELAKTYKLTVPVSAINSIKAIDNDGICEPIVECGIEVTTHIIEIGYLRERAEQNGPFTDAHEYYENIWRILEQYSNGIIKLKKRNPDYLVVYAVNDSN